MRFSSWVRTRTQRDAQLWRAEASARRHRGGRPRAATVVGGLIAIAAIVVAVSSLV